MPLNVLSTVPSGVISWSATTTPELVPVTLTVPSEPAKVGLPTPVSTVLVVGVPRPVITAEPVPDVLNAPVATSTSEPASRPTTTSVSEPATPITQSALFDVILVDLPDPNNDTLNKLYTNIFYRLCGSHLTPNGIMSVQSTSPYYAPNAFWCINKTLESEGFCVLPYHLQVPAFGDWGFNMASFSKIPSESEITVSTKYLTSDNAKAMFVFGKDEIAENVDINSLSKPMLLEYYSEAVKNWG